MKRYRHYNKQTAIILSCFGSVIEQERYFEFEAYIKKQFPDIDVFTAFSSKMVIKALEKEGKSYKNLPQVMADVDMMGYKRYIVVSVNIFPTDEHELLIRMVEGFRHFSMANIRYTTALLHKSKESSLYLKHLDEMIREGNEKTINVYIIHGVPVLNLGGLESVRYATDFLKVLNPNNLSCSLEGEYPFYAVKDSIRRDISERIKGAPDTKVQIVPMLLVSGNHYDKDMNEIADEIAQYCNASLVAPLDNQPKFNLLEQETVRQMFKENIQVEINKLGL